jgi:hypothetical protein
MTKTIDDELPTNAVPQPVGRRVVEILLLVAVFFSLAGDPPPNVNEAHYLCRLKHYWNPQWAAGDLFLESQDTQVVFIWLFGWMTRYLSLAATAWVGRVLVWTFLAWAWQRLSWRLVPRPLASVLAATLFVTLNEHLHLAGEWVVGGVEAKCFAYAFVLLALRDMIDRRWYRAWLFLGAATAFHPLVGGWSGIVCAVIWLVDDRQAVTFRSMLPGLVGAGLLSLAGILPALMLTWKEPPEVVAEANRIYVFERLPHHLAPLTLPGAEISRRLGGHMVLVIAFVILDIAMRPRNSASLYRIAQFACGALLLAAIGFAIEMTLWDYPLLAAKLLRYYWFRLTDFALPAAVAIYATACIANGLQQRRALAAWLLVGALLIVGAHIVVTTRERLLNPIPPAESKTRDLGAWIDACDWVAEHTPTYSVFLTPRLNSTFKWRTGRAEVVNRKDIPQDADSILQWNTRIKNIYYATIEGVEQPLDSLGILGTERVRDLALKYGADFVLMDRGQLLSLPVVYKNEEYIIYRVDRANDGASTNSR